MSRGPAPHEAWIGLGTNLGDREANLAAAVRHFGEHVVLVSPVFETEPWGILDQPWFLNAVVQLRWTTGARTLLTRCLAVEKALGRIREERNGPRTIDIDVLLMGPGRLREEGLTVPHPGIAGRRSVLEPWAAVAPGLIVPGLGAPLEVLEERTRGLDGHGSRPWLAPGKRASGTL
ncbi:MAG: 2-amino-4-hydroxy-6-hydroxymethyldihydropteridine diphosphokinase [Deltaproteobacteria bacterium]|nr:2-amino-4-hydroxy-6-hydroxymethyldihydropteridine diphosphokinase [Deltaproteobacteria bacterium]